MDIRVPLNMLKFGHEDGEGINARTTGRDDGIAALAANINANGQIENLIVKDAGGGFYSVANGNRRLAAFHMIYGEQSDQEIGCTLHEIDETKAFEFSLTTAVTAQQLHPVDQFEAFTRLAAHGKTEEDIARQYGMSDREVQQALALGHLSPTIRGAWRKGELKAGAARAFTLAKDHKTQDDVFADLFKDYSGDIDDHDVKHALKITHDGSGVLVEFVGIDAYVAAGGKVTRDLFGTDHQVSDPKLAKKLAMEKLAAECARLKEQGWSFAVTAETVRNTRYDYTRLKVEPAPTEAEKARLEELNLIFSKGEVADGHYHAESYAELTGAEQTAYVDYQKLKRAIELRSYTPKMMEKAGCFVSVDDDGFLEIEFGFVKPAQKQAAAETVKKEKKAAAKTAAAEGKPAPESTTLSNALKQRLEAQLIAATRDAITEEAADVSSSPLTEILAKVVCGQIVPDSPFRMPDQVRTKLPSIRQVIGASVFNPAIAKRFDAKDYFESAPKGFTLKAIIEAVNDDEARKIAKRPRPEIAKFALDNVVKTGWLPKELRTVHYKGPGSEGYKRPLAALSGTALDDHLERIAAATPAKPATTAAAVKQAKAARETKRNSVVMKRAAAAKKVAKKTRKKR